MERFGGDVRELWDRVRWMGNEYGGMDSPPHRIVIVGLPGTGKKTLFNTLWGREAVTVQPLPAGGADFGLFRLVDLPCEPDTSAFVDYEYMAYAPVPTDDAESGCLPDKQRPRLERARFPVDLAAAGRACAASGDPQLGG